MQKDLNESLLNVLPLAPTLYQKIPTRRRTYLSLGLVAIVNHNPGFNYNGRGPRRRIDRPRRRSPADRVQEERHQRRRRGDQPVREAASKGLSPLFPLKSQISIGGRVNWESRLPGGVIWRAAILAAHAEELVGRGVPTSRERRWNTVYQVLRLPVVNKGTRTAKAESCCRIRSQHRRPRRSCREGPLSARSPCLRRRLRKSNDHRPRNRPVADR